MKESDYFSNFYLKKEKRISLKAKKVYCKVNISKYIYVLVNRTSHHLKIIMRLLLFVFQNVMFVLAVTEDDRCHKSLRRHNAKEIGVGGLDVFDKMEVVRTSLSAHRKSLDETPFNNQVRPVLGIKINYLTI